MSAAPFKIGNIEVGLDADFFVIAGPCVIESEKICLDIAKQLAKISSEINTPIIFKASFDKANRSSISSFRGPGLDKGLDILKKVRKETSLALITDVHQPNQAAKAAQVVDCLQVPAFLCRQTDLLTACARTNSAVNVKKGQFLSPLEVANIVKKIKSAGNDKIMITERGASFGYNNLVSDFKSVLMMKKTGYPICYDASHSVQKPGGLGVRSGGEKEFIPSLSKAAIACGVDALFIEVHENPKKALSDGPNMIRPDELKALLKELKAIEEVLV